MFALVGMVEVLKLKPLRILLYSLKTSIIQEGSLSHTRGYDSIEGVSQYDIKGNELVFTNYRKVFSALTFLIR